MKCTIGCFAIMTSFMDHNASVFCFLVQIRGFIVLNLTGIFNIINVKRKMKQSGISNGKMTLLCKWPIL